MKRLFLSTMVMVAALAWAGCDESLSSITGPTPNLEPSLSSIQTNIFNMSDSSGRLACIGCHTDVGRNPAGGLVLLEGRSYQQLVARVSTGKPSATRVIANDPDNSYMVQKLEGDAGIVGERMPRGNGPFLTEGQMIVIRQWIKDGAPNN
jgi:hypothetical protein